MYVKLETVRSFNESVSESTETGPTVTRNHNRGVIYVEKVRVSRFAPGRVRNDVTIGRLNFWDFGSFFLETAVLRQESEYRLRVERKVSTGFRVRSRCGGRGSGL